MTLASGSRENTKMDDRRAPGLKENTECKYCLSRTTKTTKKGNKKSNRKEEGIFRPMKSRSVVDSWRNHSSLGWEAFFTVSTLPRPSPPHAAETGSHREAPSITECVGRHWPPPLPNFSPSLPASPSFWLVPQRGGKLRTYGKESFLLAPFCGWEGAGKGNGGTRTLRRGRCPRFVRVGKSDTKHGPNGGNIEGRMGQVMTQGPFKIINMKWQKSSRKHVWDRFHSSARYVSRRKKKSFFSLYIGDG